MYYGKIWTNRGAARLHVDSMALTVCCLPSSNCHWTASWTSVYRQFTNGRKHPSHHRCPRQRLSGGSMRRIALISLAAVSFAACSSESTAPSASDEQVNEFAA